jgi:hypothetical protein
MTIAISQAARSLGLIQEERFSVSHLCQFASTSASSPKNTGKIVDEGAENGGE